MSKRKIHICTKQREIPYYGLLRTADTWGLIAERHENDGMTDEDWENEYSNKRVHAYLENSEW